MIPQKTRSVPSQNTDMSSPDRFADKKEVTARRLLFYVRSFNRENLVVLLFDGLSDLFIRHFSVKRDNSNAFLQIDLTHCPVYAVDRPLHTVLAVFTVHSLDMYRLLTDLGSGQFLFIRKNSLTASAASQKQQ